MRTFLKGRVIEYDIQELFKHPKEFTTAKLLAKHQPLKSKKRKLPYLKENSPNRPTLKEIINFKSNNNIPTNQTKTYVMKNKRSGLYKIGKSNNPKYREKTLQSEEPNIVMIKVWNKDIEAQLHKEYKNFRVRGEWFKLNKIQVQYICTQY